MRTHRQIIIDAGGPSSVAQLLAGPDASSALIDKMRKRANGWRVTNSIPAPFWRPMVDHGLTTLDELADACAIPTPANDVPPSEAVA